MTLGAALSGVPRRGEWISTTFPMGCVKPRPGVFRSWVGAHSVPRKMHELVRILMVRPEGPRKRLRTPWSYAHWGLAVVCGAPRARRFKTRMPPSKPNGEFIPSPITRRPDG